MQALPLDYEDLLISLSSIGGFNSTSTTAIRVDEDIPPFRYTILCNCYYSSLNYILGQFLPHLPTKIATRAHQPWCHRREDPAAHGFSSPHYVPCDKQLR